MDVIGRLKKAIWETNADDYKGAARFLLRLLQFSAVVLRNFWFDNCLLRASALAFTTILSLVPFLALAFSVLKGFGVQNQVEPLVLEQLSGGSQEVAARIIDYINNTNMRSLGIFGLVALLFTAITLLDNIEETFNKIWSVTRTRPLQRKFSDYLSVLISGPVLIFTAISVTTYLESRVVFKTLAQTNIVGDLLMAFLHLLPYVVVWIALTFLYLFIPNTAVRFRSALLGAVIAGTCWQAAQWWYIHFQVGVSRYNAIYGTMAVLPIFMVWIYVSWLIVLLGVEIVYGHQNIRALQREMRAGALCHRTRELLSLAILVDIVAAFVEGSGDWTASRLSDDLEISERVILELVDGLVTAGFLVTVVGPTPTYRPAQEPDTILVAEVLAMLKQPPRRWQPLRLTPVEASLEELLSSLDSAVAKKLHGMNLRQLAAETKAAAAATH